MRHALAFVLGTIVVVFWVIPLAGIAYLKKIGNDGEERRFEPRSLL